MTYDISTDRYRDGWRSVAHLPGGKQRASATCDSKEGSEMDLHRKLKDEFEPAPKFEPKKRYEAYDLVSQLLQESPTFDALKKSKVKLEPEERAGYEGWGGLAPRAAGRGNLRDLEVRREGKDLVRLQYAPLLSGQTYLSRRDCRFPQDRRTIGLAFG